MVPKVTFSQHRLTSFKMKSVHINKILIQTQNCCPLKSCLFDITIYVIIQYITKKG